MGLYFLEAEIYRFFMLQLSWYTLYIPGHPAELSDSVKLLLTDAKSHVFEIDQVLKDIY